MEHAIVSREFNSENATVKSATRVLQILELFKEMQRPMSTTDIAVQLNYPISSTAALLKSLTALGYLIFDRDTRTYQASLRIALLGGWAPEDRSTLTRLQEVTERLAAASSQSVMLAIRNDIHIQYVRVVTPKSGGHLPLSVGSRQRLVDAPTGHALLALDDDRTVDRLVHRANAERSNGQSRIDPLAIRREMSSIRENGYAYSAGGFVDCLAAIAVPLHISEREPPIVLGLAGLADEVNEDSLRLIDLVCDAAREIRPASASDMHIRHDSAYAEDFCVA